MTATPAPPQASPVRTTLLLGGTLLALAAAVLLSLTVGSKPTTLAQVWAALTGTADPYTTAVVESRYPRTILGILTGAALAVAGLLLQGITRNPLADPGLLGVNAGAMGSRRHRHRPPRPGLHHGNGLVGTPRGTTRRTGRLPPRRPRKHR